MWSYSLTVQCATAKALRCDSFSHCEPALGFQLNMREAGEVFKPNWIHLASIVLMPT